MDVTKWGPLLNLTAMFCAKYSIPGFGDQIIDKITDGFWDDNEGIEDFPWPSEFL